MSSANSRLSLKSLVVLMSTLAVCVFGSAAAHASGPRLLSHEVSGTYDMQDGSTLRIDVEGQQRVLVQASSAEYWSAQTANLLVSPDGLRRITLLRDVDGRVDRIELHITKSPLDVAVGELASASIPAAAAP